MKLSEYPDPANDNQHGQTGYVSERIKKIKEAEKAVEDLFYPGAGGYPMIEAGADFRTLTGIEPPIHPNEIVDVLIKLQTGKIAGGHYCIIKYLQSQPTMDHVKGVEQMLIKRLSEIRKRLSSEDYINVSDSPELREEMNTIQDLMGVIHMFFMSVANESD